MNDQASEGGLNISVIREVIIIVVIRWDKPISQLGIYVVITIVKLYDLLLWVIMITIIRGYYVYYY
jgi:uncharacterized membrane protein (DUF373 family)